MDTLLDSGWIGMTKITFMNGFQIELVLVMRSYAFLLLDLTIHLNV